MNKNILYRLKLMGLSALAIIFLVIVFRHFIFARITSRRLGLAVGLFLFGVYLYAGMIQLRNLRLWLMAIPGVFFLASAVIILT